MLKGLYESIVDIVYPRRCPVCSDIVIPKSEKICPDCRNKLQIIKEPRCKKCSKPIERQEVEYCFDCSTRQFHYRYGISLWVYDKTMRKSIADYKYKGKKEFADFYTEELLKYYRENILKIMPDALIPVPLHKSKQLKRGFNQAELLARGIGKELHIPVITSVLYRNKKTLPQKELSNKERLKNLQQAFQIDLKELHKNEMPRRVILVDDIYTTGSTIEACCTALRNAGVEEVYFISLCIGKGF